MTGRKISAALLGAASLCTLLAACAGDANESATTTDSAAASAATASDTAGAAGGTATASAGGAFLDPNTASAQELEAIPGVDSTMAAAIVAGRPYQDMTAVDRVLAGRLSEAQRDTIYTRLFRPIDLNTASADEIMLIPGVGARMRHEFEEYRPYRTIAQFRREIGKYVDSTEVARLERYVRIPAGQQ
jgi:DNA uptake protein ComE-like DNA-binding protein